MDTFVHTLRPTCELFLEHIGSVLGSLAGLPGSCAVACALPPVIGAVMVIHHPHRPRLFKQPHPPRPHDSCVCESGGVGGGGSGVRHARDPDPLPNGLHSLT